MQKLSLRAVLFDLDQTLTDRARSVEAVAVKMLDAFAKVCSDLNARTIRDTILQLDQGGYRKRDEFSALMVEALKWHMPARELEAWWRTHFPPCAVEALGAREVMATLHARGIRLGIVTNGTSLSQNAKIDVLGFRPYLSTVQISGAIGIEKPDPEIFRRALRELDVAPQDAMFVGDHPVNDILAAHAVGMQTAWVSGRFDWPQDVPQPGIVIESLSELLPLVLD